MTWIPPFFTCGECGGEIGRWPVMKPTATQRAIMEDLEKDQLLNWKHRTVPEGTVPHVPILGTKAHTPRIPERVEVQVGPRLPPPPPEMPARPALADDLPGPAKQLDRLAEQHGWTVQAWIMRGTLMDVRWLPMRVVNTVVLWLDRDGHRLVVHWVTRKLQPGELVSRYEFEAAWSLGHRVNLLTNAELKQAVKYPRALCEDCRQPPALHVLTEGVLVCNDKSTPIEGDAA